MADPVLETLFVALITLITLARGSNALFQAESVSECVCYKQKTVAVVTRVTSAPVYSKQRFSTGIIMTQVS